MGADIYHIISEGKLHYNFLFYLFLKAYDIWDFVHLVNNNIVNYDVDRKTYVEINTEGGPTIFAVSKREFIEMWNHSLFYSHGLVGSKVDHTF